jgi:hypothetical protein
LVEVDRDRWPGCAAVRRQWRGGRSGHRPTTGRRPHHCVRVTRSSPERPPRRGPGFSLRPLS